MNGTLPYVISEADKRSYREDGAVCLRGILDADWCERMLAASVALMDRPDDQTPNQPSSTMPAAAMS